MIKPTFSIVTPVYKAELIIPELVKRIIDSVSSIIDQFEIILVEDGSPDNSWPMIVEECKKDTRVKGIQLSRNFGQHYAITAGLDIAQGEWIVVMDCDLQDRPEEIPTFYNKALEGFDIVMGERIIRQDTFLKRFSSQIFYTVFNYLTGLKQDNSVANFGIYSRKVINSVNNMREPLRAFSPMIRWIGFKKAFVTITHSERKHGKSSYNWEKLLKLAFEIIISYSDKPLRVTIKLGLILSVLSMMVAFFYLLEYIKGGITVEGFPSIIISIWFLGGLIIFVLGILGLYLSKIFDAVKNRPLYFISETINL